jgi:hypothetical protein
MNKKQSESAVRETQGVRGKWNREKAFRKYTCIPVRVRARIEQLSVATGYELDGPGSIPGRSKNSSLLHNFQAGSAAHQPPVEQPMGTWATFPGS